MADHFELLTRIGLTGTSAAMDALRQSVASAASTQAKVLITGETGVGKEVVARLIHQDGTRRSRRFVAVNCSGISENLLESELFGHTRGSFTGAYRDKTGLTTLAHGGTLFLDELGEMSLRMQAVLLRFAETGEVQPVGSDSVVGRSDVRLITATHRDLRTQIAMGAFREDLYYRLNVIHIQVPPLRARGDDIRILLHHFLVQAGEAHTRRVPVLTPDAEAQLLAYAWPGNVRELKNLTERLVVRGHGHEGPVTIEDLPEEMRSCRRAPGGATAPSAVTRGILPPKRESPVPVADRLWAQLLAGDNFWVAIQRPFKSHDITRDDVRAVVARGLEQTRGSYRQLVAVFRLQPDDYKRFLAFLSQHDCKVRFQDHRSSAPEHRSAPAVSVAPQARRYEAGASSPNHLPPP